MKPTPMQRLVDQADAITDGTHEGIEDWRDALDLYKAAAEMGSGEAWSRMGDMHFNDEFFKSNPEKAIQFYKKAISCGYDSYSELMSVYSYIEEHKSMASLLRVIANKYKSKDIGEQTLFIAAGYCALQRVEIDKNLFEEIAPALEFYKKVVGANYPEESRYFKMIADMSRRLEFYSSN